MYPTVAELLTLPVLRHGRPRLAGGSDGAGNEVRWVHVAEVADIAHLLRGGELVLTTGIALPDDPAALAGYVADLAEVGAAGLVVELVRRWRGQLPPALVRAANEHRLPLVTLAEETRFVSVTEAVIARIRDTQLAELRAAEQIHEVFTALTVAGAEPAEVLREVARLGKVAVVLETAAHDVLGYDTAGGAAEDLLQDWRQRSRAVQPSERTGYDATTGWLVTVVGARGEDWGRLVLLCQEQPPHHQLVLAERAASALAVHRLMTRDSETLERQTHRGLLTELLAPGALDGELAVRANALGVPLAGRVLVGMAVRPRATNVAAPALATHELLGELAETTALAARRTGVPALVGVLDDTSVQVLVSIDKLAAVDPVLRAIARGVHQPGGTSRQAYAVLVAAGTAVGSLIEARRSLTEATHVATAALRAGPTRDFHRLDDVRLRGLLHLLCEDERLIGFTERELGPLLARDARQGSRLVEVLRRYLEHGGNKSAAAASAHLSRTAYYQQLARIEQVLGVSLEDPESMLSLYVALLAIDAGATRPR